MRRTYFTDADPKQTQIKIIFDQDAKAAVTMALAVGYQMGVQAVMPDKGRDFADYLYELNPKAMESFENFRKLVEEVL